MCNPGSRGSWVEILRVTSQLTICLELSHNTHTLQPNLIDCSQDLGLPNTAVRVVIWAIECSWGDMLQVRWRTWKLISDIYTDICTWAIIWRLSWHIISKLADCSQAHTSPVRWLSKVVEQSVPAISFIHFVFWLFESNVLLCPLRIRG